MPRIAAPATAKSLKQSQPETLPEYPGYRVFLLDTPLYAKFARPVEADLLEVFYNGVKLDGHCPSCGSSTTFASVATQTSWGSGAPGGFPTATLSCARNSTHQVKLWFRLTAADIQKIGQFPSHADIANDESKKYRKILGRENVSEFHMAIGLAAHGVGIGSFVYLRRIFERLIWNRFEEFCEVEQWNREEFQKLRMAEKVQFLATHLPAFLVENAKMYSILSRGVHELSDQECLAFFPVLRESTVTILDEDAQKKEAIDRRESLRKAIQEFSDKS